MTAKTMIAVRGHWRLSARTGERVWINPHLRASGGEAVTEARRRLADVPMVFVDARSLVDVRPPVPEVQPRPAYGREGRYGGFCESCKGTGWVFREPPEDTTRCKLCPTCEGRGRT